MKPLTCLLAIFSVVVEAGPLINTRENPLYHGVDLTVDYALVLSAAVPTLDPNSIANSLIVQDTTESLISAAARSAPGTWWLRMVAPEDEVATDPGAEAPQSSLTRNATWAAGAAGLLLAGYLLVRVRKDEGRVTQRVEKAVQTTRRIWFLPGIMDSREVWGRRTPFWNRVDRFFDRIESGLAIFRRKRA